MSPDGEMIVTGMGDETFTGNIFCPETLPWIPPTPYVFKPCSTCAFFFSPSYSSPKYDAILLSSSFPLATAMFMPKTLFLFRPLYICMFHVFFFFFFALPIPLSLSVQNISYVLIHSAFVSVCPLSFTITLEMKHDYLWLRNFARFCLR